MIKNSIHLSCFLWLLAGGLPGQLPEEEGPWSTKLKEIRFEDEQFGRGEIRGRIYWPTGPKSAEATEQPPERPFPLVGFMHGYMGQPKHYDSLALHLASWGFIVASIGTELDSSGNLHAEARDTQALLHWITAQGAKEKGWLSGKVSNGPWGASGHSMGGGACLELIRIEPKVQVIAPLQPWIDPVWGGGRQLLKNLKRWKGRSWFVAGELDTTCTPEMVRLGFDAATSSLRNIWTEVSSMGHLGPLNHPPSHKNLKSQEKVRIHKRILGGFFRAELCDEEDLYRDLLGLSIDSASLKHETRCTQPIVWWEDNSLAVASLPGQEITLFGATHKTNDKGILKIKIDIGNTPPGPIQVSAGQSKSRVLHTPEGQP